MDGNMCPSDSYVEMSPQRCWCQKVGALAGAEVIKGGASWMCPDKSNPRELPAPSTRAQPDGAICDPGSSLTSPELPYAWTLGFSLWDWQPETDAICNSPRLCSFILAFGTDIGRVGIEKKESIFLFFECHHDISFASFAILRNS